MSDALDNLRCAVTDAINFYDDEGYKKEVAICELIERLVDELEWRENDRMMKSQPEYWADIRRKERTK